MSPVIALQGDDRALFASDVHLGDHDPATAEVFLAQLHRYATGASHVFLLGDLFEAWVGDDWADEVGTHTLQALAELSAGGCALFVMRGNRDFLLDAPMDGLGSVGPGGEALRSGAPAGPFSQRTGATMLPDPCVVSLFGEPALLCHGDALCTDDADYQRFRALTRDPGWQRTFLARPRDERIAVAQDLRARSELSKSTKDDALMDVNPQAVEAAMREAGVRLMIHGHTHRPARHSLAIDGRPAQRWVLSDWDAAHGRGDMLLATREGLARIRI